MPFYPCRLGLFFYSVHFLPTGFPAYGLEAGKHGEARIRPPAPSSPSTLATPVLSAGTAAIECHVEASWPLLLWVTCPLRYKLRQAHQFNAAAVLDRLVSHDKSPRVAVSGDGCFTSESLMRLGRVQPRLIWRGPSPQLQCISPCLSTYSSLEVHVHG